MPSAAPDRPAPPPAGGRYLGAMLLALVVGVLVALHEVDVQSARVVDPVDTYAWPFTTLFGFRVWDPTGWPALTRWRGGHALLPQSELLAIFGRLLAAWLLLSVVLAALCVPMALAVVRAVAGPGALRRIGVVLVATAGGLTVGQALAAALVWRAGWPDPLVRALTGLTWLGWILVVAFVVLRAVLPWGTPGWFRFRVHVPRAVRAVVHQRFSVIVIIPLLVLTVLSGPAVLEQLPDAQRSWVAPDGSGIASGIAAFVVLVAVSAVIFVFGRYRSGYAVRLVAQAVPSVDAPLWPWLVGPVAGLIMLVVALTRGLGHGVIAGRLVVFLLLPLLVAAGSYVLRRTGVLPDDRGRGFRPQRADLAAIRYVGNALALALPSIAGIGLFRSFTAMRVLRVGAPGERVAVDLLLIFGVVIIVVPWLLAWWLSRRPQPTRLLARPGAAHTLLRLGFGPPHRMRVRAVLFGAVVAAFLVVGVLPAAASRMGLMAVAMLAIMLLVGIPAGMSIVLQEGRPGEVFRMVGLHRTPLITVLVLIMIGSGLIGRSTTIHPVVSSSGPTITRPGFDHAVDAFLAASTDACDTTMGTRTVRPMLLIAAEGGGIRAAYWTTAALAAIEHPDAQHACSSATLFSAGASGGSVGLTVARFSPDAAAAKQTVAAMAQPEPLGAASIGLFIRDLWYGVTGVPLTADDTPFGTWADRARLLELGWEHASGWGDRPFLSQVGAGGITGPLVINSSSTAGRCRAWVSQYDLPSTAVAVPGDGSCTDGGAAGPRALDLLSAYGNGGAGTCLGTVSAVTAALLTARFPYVTPGGVVGPCTHGDITWPQTQLVDGGYLENSGIGTITDLAPSWLAQVRAHNAATLAQASGGVIIVPIVVYLANGETSAARSPRPRPPISELLLPPATLLGAASALSSAATLLQRADALLSAPGAVCPAGAECAAALARYPRVVVVDRAAQPEVSTPLGWVLSPASMGSLDDALAREAATRCTTEAIALAVPTCAGGYAALGDLLAALTRA